ncbi:Helix-turn-helix domain protein [Rubripirellula lacrimiformis]|uniref:Helix-turn-helix domain protein n=1 Tax=Rubripirellula lacrimiformis TaxID=1930273 RepID=A0A517N9L6_9BACT|nr:helix-turn-helix domain-containing protein [Rubripirellula lacrimiformis]QDT03822.1 Helix-turn-helix domain protein [Rubripirellula lacrimiformis]
MVARQPQYSPKQVAEALGASESSVKRWCDSGAIPIIRTLGGHRRITLDGLQQYLRTSGRVLVDADVLGLPDLPLSRPAVIPGQDCEIRRAFRQSLAACDEDGCRALLRRYIESGRSRSEAADDLITDAMHGIGHAWQCNDLDPYQERRACDACIRMINELRAELPTCPVDAPMAIGGSLSGDPYQLPTSLVELSLREAGWNAISLGSNLPVESFRQAVFDMKPKMVWLSVSVVGQPSEFVSNQNRLADQLGDDVALLVGGRGVTDGLRPKLRYTAYCDGLRHLVELASVLIDA